ncbi:RNA-dependent RNA polymerase [Wuhan pillworm virus 2]|uniref:RNA-dependent RNA polymerase n=1 Tax=Wuhan pillworm virus 2 TaxID=1923745 RepID=UPI00090C4763|nr:RNA-dependent RNA polymerase [Wuhan pillworm virus 2]APG78803.1 RNA-dependent RNA polymerase [Wuhan pillworm virus 2]
MFEFEYNDVLELTDDDLAQTQWHDLLGKEGIRSLLNQQDYSLNSPLIEDRVNELLISMSDSEYVPRIGAKVTKEAASVFKEHVQPRNLRGVSEHHKIFASISLNSEVKTKSYEKWSETTNYFASKTEEITNSFFKGWLGETSRDTTKPLLDRRIRKWGELFLDSYWITMAMNEQTKTGLETICAKRSWIVSYEGPSKIPVIYGRSPVWGDFIITGGFFLSEAEKTIIERPFFLMMKDTWLARFNTMVMLSGAQGADYPKTLIENLVRIYEIGDLALIEYGNDAYEGIKLLEPICLDRLGEITRKYRPLIPRFEEFTKFISETIVKLPLQLRTRIQQMRAIIDRVDLEIEVINVYGIFRHWGHPYINYLQGLQKFFDQTHCRKDIDKEFAGLLASDLARMVLKKIWTEKKFWAVDIGKISKRHPLYQHIEENTWPKSDKSLGMGDTWHLLPLVQCFEIPDVVDPSQIYADKSHSLDRSEVLQWIKGGSKGPVPTRRVLKTFLTKKATNWPEFLEKIDKEGLDWESLVIGLRAKERELKLTGRFFALMSWELREYFVITEWLIKKYFVPLLRDLTMADDLNDVISKMLSSTSGQGLDDYSVVSISNHLDYEKWNNHQRKESNDPVFRVMGQFLGKPNLFTRTHEFFEKSLIYYVDRPDLIRVDEENRVYCPAELVAWEGQPGGMEGLRQGGWTMTGGLNIKRSSRVRNTAVQAMIQGDNQVISTKYKLRKVHGDEDLVDALQEIIRNNNMIIQHIRDNAAKLGLIVNESETLKSAEVLVYGKVPVVRGNVLGMDSKRYSRISCVNNDQIPSIGSIMASVGTNILTASHFSTSPRKHIEHFNFYCNLVLTLIEDFNPTTKQSIHDHFDPKNLNSQLSFRIRATYLDPSLGGVSGMSLTRFLIRMFPDPVSEGLSFWKVVHDNTPVTYLKDIARASGWPKLASYSITHFDKLLENPTSLNTIHGISLTYYLKQEIRKSLLRGVTKIENEIVEMAVRYTKDGGEEFIRFLEGITPCFPRFLSEYKAATFFGIADSVLQLFENSRTIRTHLADKFPVRATEVQFKAEVMTIKGLCESRSIAPYLWDCSATHADMLRAHSWEREIVGATIPHPIELLGKLIKFNDGPESCCIPQEDMRHLTTYIPFGLINYTSSRGPLPAYLGSRTKETTSVIQPWEKESKVPLLRRALKLRDAIHWFVNPKTKLAKSILSVLNGLTNIEWDDGLEGYKRTGSRIHRFTSSRQSAGGYSATSPCKLTRLNTTTDTFTDFSEDNYDFMFQALILYCQVSAGELHDNDPRQGTYHAHINCNQCIRPITEEELTSELEFIHPNCYEQVKLWIPGGEVVIKENSNTEITVGDWNSVHSHEKSNAIGRAIGFLFGDLIYTTSAIIIESNLFPNSLNGLQHPDSFFEGLLSGLAMAGILDILFRRSTQEKDDPTPVIVGSVRYLTRQLCASVPFLNTCRSPIFHNLLISIPHRSSPSYPASTKDLGKLVLNYFGYLLRRDISDLLRRLTRDSNRIQWVFADLYGTKMVGLLSIARYASTYIYNFGKMSDRNWFKRARSILRGLKNDIQCLRSEDWTGVKIITKQIRLCTLELRKAIKECKSQVQVISPPITWDGPTPFPISSVNISYGSMDFSSFNMTIPQRSCPLISGLRIMQLSTGAHYKMSAIVKKLGLKYVDFLCGGDGSGGMTACLLQLNLTSRGIFNSLLDFDGVMLRGGRPSPPSALLSTGSNRYRCVNFSDCWESPSDLANRDTWEYFHRLVDKFNLDIDLILLDMETRCHTVTQRIVDQLHGGISEFLKIGGTVIFKTYLGLLVNKKIDILEKLGVHFGHIVGVQTSVSSMYTSEIYLVFMKYTQKPYTTSYPKEESLVALVDSSYSLRSAKEEFCRALSLKKYDFISGFHDLLIPNRELELLSLCEKTGLYSGVAESFIRSYLGKVSESQKNISNKFFALMILVVNSSIPVTVYHKIEPTPPSDQVTEDLLSLMCGFLYWFAWSIEDQELYDIAYSRFSDCHPLFWSWVTVRPGKKFLKRQEKIEATIKGTTSKQEYTKFYRQSWALDRGSVNKSISLDRSAAAVGQWIRIFSRWGKKASPIDIEQTIKCMEPYNHGLDKKTLRLFTGIPQYFSKVRASTKGWSHPGQVGAESSWVQ